MEVKRLKEICELIVDCPHSTAKDEGVGYPLIRTTNVGVGRLDLRGVHRVSERVYHIRNERAVPSDGDIILAREAPVGNAAIIMPGQKVCLGQRVVLIRANRNVVNPMFLVYYLLSDEIQHRLKNSANGAVVAHLNMNEIRELLVSIPDIKTQNRIAKILSSFDDKIDINRRINDNLEYQAQAIFKSWFVDFDPFKDGDFVESELGMIPKGWKIGVYDEIISDTISGDWGKETEEGNYTHRVACVRGCDFQDIKNGLRGKTPERFILEKNFQNKHFCDKDMLVEISGGTATVSTGRVCPISQQLIDKYNGDIVCTNFCKLVRPKNGYGAFMYYSWLNKYNNRVMFGYENGTSGIKNFRIKDFITIEPVVLPPLDIIIDFQRIIDNIQKQIQINGTESQRLAEIRDTLLPRLMSGELKVNEIETLK